MKRATTAVRGTVLGLVLALGGGAMAFAVTTPTLPGQASDDALVALEGAAQAAEGQTGALAIPDENLDELQPVVSSTEGNGDGDDAEAFAAWVGSLPEGLGCLRGQLVAQHARGDHRGDFEGPDIESVEDAAAALEGDAPGRCAAALGADDGVQGAGQGGPPDWAGPPAHAGADDDGEGPPAWAGRPEQVGARGGPAAR